MGIEKSALRLDETRVEDFIPVPPIQPNLAQNIINYPRSVGVALVEDKQRLERLRKRRRKLALFIKTEVIALFFLALALTGATSEVIRQAGLRSAFKWGLLPAALAVAIIPVIFFGMTRNEYHYRARRRR